VIGIGAGQQSRIHCTRLAGDKADNWSVSPLHTRCYETLITYWATHTHTYTHTTVLLLFWNLSGTTWVSRYQKDKTRKVSGSSDQQHAAQFVAVLQCIFC